MQLTLNGLKRLLCHTYWISNSTGSRHLSEPITARGIPKTVQSGAEGCGSASCVVLLTLEFYSL